MNEPTFRDAAMRALDAQVELIHWLRTSPVVERFHSAWEGDHLEAIQVKILDSAETYSLSSEIYDLIASGAELLPPVKMALHDLPTPSGFIYCDESVMIHDVQGRPTALKAFVWSLAVAAIDPERDGKARVYPIPDGKVPTAMEGAERQLGVSIWLYTDPWTETEDHLHELVSTSDTPRKLANLVLLNHGQMPLGEEPDGEYEKWLFAFWRFVQEPWMDTRHIVPSRQAVRRAQRAHINGAAEVRVVRLRKAPERHVKPDGENPQAWTHRWLVRGHWRNQWMPKAERHELRWIAPFVKGPEDMPLILKEVVYAVER